MPGIISSASKQPRQLTLPGSSIWLLPSPGPLESALESLITDTLPRHFLPTESVPAFLPHLTLTSSISEERFADPLAVLAAIPIPQRPVVAFKELKVGETFFTRLALHVERTPSLLALAEQCRKLVPGTVDEEAAAWAESAFVPHVSLVYAGLKAEDVCSSVLDRARADVAAAGLGFGNESALSGWEGGRLVLVQTWRRIEDWNIIAERVL